MTKTLTPAELAQAIGTDPKTVRKFLRSPEGLDRKVGKGHRWAIEAKQVRSLKARFVKWEAARQAAIAEARAARAAEAQKAADDAEVTDDEVEDIDELED